MNKEGLGIIENSKKESYIIIDNISGEILTNVSDNPDEIFWDGFTIENHDNSFDNCVYGLENCNALFETQDAARDYKEKLEKIFSDSGEEIDFSILKLITYREIIQRNLVSVDEIK